MNIPLLINVLQIFVASAAHIRYPYDMDKC